MTTDFEQPHKRPPNRSPSIVSQFNTRVNKSTIIGKLLKLLTFRMAPYNAGRYLQLTRSVSCKKVKRLNAQKIEHSYNEARLEFCTGMHVAHRYAPVATKIAFVK